MAEQEREEWSALVEADTLHMLPKGALIASIKSLAERLLELTDTPANTCGECGHSDHRGACGKAVRVNGRGGYACGCVKGA